MSKLARRVSSSVLRPYLPCFLFVVIAVILWELGVDFFHVPHFIIPLPSEVAEAVNTSGQAILKHTYVTILEAFLGYFVALVSGVVIGISIFYSKLVRSIVFPLILFIQTTPKTAVAPLIILWFGLGIESKVVLSFLVCFFPILLNTFDGLNAAPREIIYLARSLNATKFDIFRKIYFFNTLPYIFTGLKVGVTMAVVGAVVGEFIGASEGLGYLLLLTSYELRANVTFAVLIWLTIIGISFYGLILLLERVLLRWHTAMHAAK